MHEPRRLEIVERLFHEALECDDAFRAGFLAKACAGDVELLAEVASLLASYERDRNFLQKSAFNRSALEVAGTVLEEKAAEVPEVPRVKVTISLEKSDAAGWAPSTKPLALTAR